MLVRVGARTSVDANIEDSNKAKKGTGQPPTAENMSGNSAGTGPADCGTRAVLTFLRWSSYFQDKKGLRSVRGVANCLNNRAKSFETIFQ